MPESPSTRLGLVAPSGTDTIATGDDQIRAIIAQLEAVGAAFQQGTSRPAASSALEGYFYANTSTAVVSYCTGGIWLDFQPYNSDLVALAALSTTSYGRSLLETANAAALRTLAGTVIGTDVQAYDSDLAAIAALSTASFGRSLLTSADAISLQRTAVIATVTTLPSSPIDGQECYYLADSGGSAGGPVIWHLRYRSTDSKWYLLGGAPLYAETTTAESPGQAANTFGTTGMTAGPNVTVPLAGEYDVEIGFHGYGAATVTDLRMSYSIGGTAASVNDAAMFEVKLANTTSVATRTRRKTLAAGDALAAKYRSSRTDSVFSNRYMRVVPVRVS